MTPVVDWAKLRAAYEEGNADIETLCKRFAVSQTEFDKRREDEGWSRPHQELTMDREGAAGRVTGAERLQMVEALFRSCAIHADEIEKRLSDMQALGQVADEKDTRILASLIRSVEKILELDARTKAIDKEAAEHADPGYAARTEQLRKALYERLTRLNQKGDDG